VAPREHGRPTARLVGAGSAVVFAVVLGGAVAGAGSGPHTTAPVGGLRAFTISGRVAGLYPGRTVPLTLTVKDIRPFSITVTSITTTVRKVGVGCPASVVSVTPYAGSLHLLPGHIGTVQVSVSMAHAATDGCLGKTIPFRYRGQATAP
jgi:hypothetical protein